MPPDTFSGSDYYFEDEWNEAYSQKVETLLIRIETDTGLYGWGESQAPIVPEVAGNLIDRLWALCCWGAIHGIRTSCGSECIRVCMCGGRRPGLCLMPSAAWILPCGTSKVRPQVNRSA